VGWGILFVILHSSGFNWNTKKQTTFFRDFRKFLDHLTWPENQNIGQF